MSRPRFAAITSDLLARKGEARPWGELPKLPMSWHAAPTPEQAAPAPTPVPEQIAMPVPPPLLAAPAPHICELPRSPAAHGEVKKIAVRLSGHDYKRLGILAVKRGSSRQRLLQEALDSLLTGLPLPFGGCACLGAAHPARD